MDPYEILKIPFLAGKVRIRKAFTDLCRVEHPDKNNGYESLEWQMGEYAHTLLLDPESRARYDSSRIARNFLSATEGLFAFGFAVAQSLGSFMADASEVASKQVTEVAQRLGILDSARSLMRGNGDREQ